MEHQPSALLEGMTPRGRSLNFSVHIEQTQDVELLKTILLTPGIAEWIGDDGADIVLPAHPKCYYFLAKMDVGFEPGIMDDRIIGCVAFSPINGITWNPHLAILPRHRGLGTAVMQAGIDWMFTHTPCEKLIAFPPTYNKPMIRVFEKSGFENEGFSSNSVRKNGEIYGRYIMGKNKCSAE